MILTKSFLVACFFLFAANLSAQLGHEGGKEYITISGKVFGRETGPVFHAYVALWSDKGNEIEQTYTDIDGRYKLIIPKDSVDGIRMSLICRAIGYETVKVKRVPLEHPEYRRDVYLKQDYSVIDCKGNPVTNEMLKKKVFIYK